jgi:hypothetical protein
MAVTFQADAKRLIFAVILALLGTGIGFAVGSSIPVGMPIRSLFVLIPLATGMLSIGRVLRRRVIVSEAGFRIRNMFAETHVASERLAGWKMKGNNRSPSLHLLTREGKQIHIYDLGLLGISDVGAAGKKIAKELKKSGQTFENFPA